MVNFLELDLETHRLILEELRGVDLNSVAATCTYLRQCALTGIFAERLWKVRCVELLGEGVVALHARAAPAEVDLARYWRSLWREGTDLRMVRWWREGAQEIKHHVDEADAKAAEELRATTIAAAESAAQDNEDGLGAARRAAVLVDAEENEERVRQMLRAKLARSGHRATLCGSCVLITGGILRDGSPEMDVLAVHLDTLAVTRPEVLGEVPATRFRHTANRVEIPPGSRIEEQVQAGLGAGRHHADGYTIVLFGGYNTTGQEFGGLEALWLSKDVKYVVWISLASTGNHPAPRFHHSCEAYNGGRSLVVYAGEGEAINDSTDTHAPAVYLLDVGALHWTRKATLSQTPAENPGLRSLHMSSLRTNPDNGHEELIVFGGYTQNLLMKMFVFTLDLETFWWQRSVALPPDAEYPLPQPRQRSACFKLTSTWLLVFGGSPNQGDFLSDVHKLHIPTLTWGPPVTVQGKGSKSTRRIAGHSLTGLIAFGGCVPTIMGIMPVPKADILLLGSDPTRLGMPAEADARTTSATAVASQSAPSTPFPTASSRSGDESNRSAPTASQATPSAQQAEHAAPALGQHQLWADFSKLPSPGASSHVTGYPATGGTAVADASRAARPLEHARPFHEMPGQLWRDPATGHVYFQPAPDNDPVDQERVRASTLEWLQQIGVPSLAVRANPANPMSGRRPLGVHPHVSGLPSASGGGLAVLGQTGVDVDIGDGESGSDSGASSGDEEAVNLVGQRRVCLLQ
ncbi:hypothetical protein WJX72_011927 [[Myrmecia] bisecta]|uniref:F-box domain-containing protein n=1 Tax=[Myrmecia] bisecta TaxID=41462 RepID=A0AAW1Q5A1_9CHLO